MLHDSEQTSATSSFREKDDDYHNVVAVLNADWRVIECRDRVPCVIQRRDRRDQGTDKQPETLATVRWRGLRYHRGRDTLLTALARLKVEVSPSAMAMLMALPDWIHQVHGNMP